MTLSSQFSMATKPCNASTSLVEWLPKACSRFSKFTGCPPRLAECLEQPVTDQPFKILVVCFNLTTEQLYVRMNNINEFQAQQGFSKRQAASLLTRAFDPLH
jgi:hypothetical protein